MQPYGNISGTTRVHGRARSGYVYPGGRTLVTTLDPLTRRESFVSLPGQWRSHSDWQQNLTLYDWATINGQLLRGSLDGKSYHIGGIYVEFENNGGAPVTAPTFDRSGSKAYYDALAVDANRDYLRIALTASTLTSSDTDLFPSGNIATFFVQTTGVVGVHGKTFSDAVSSRIFGAALVAFPDSSDASQDIVHSRFYFDTDKQLVKQSNSQVSVTWPLNLN